MHLEIKLQIYQRGGMSLLSNDCNSRVGPEQRWVRESASTRPSSETCGDLFGFKIHFHFLVPLSLSTGKEHLLSPRFRDSLVLMLKSLLLTFPSILVRTPSCLRILRTLRNFGNFEYFENFEDYEEKQKTSRLDPTIQHLGLPCLLTALP